VLSTLPLAFTTAAFVQLSLPIDSAKTVRSIRSAQTSFESFKRAHLPRGDRYGGTCDVRIGRYCYWRGDENEEKRPEEPREIGERRVELLRDLDAAARAIPGDPWVAGQRIRYLVEAEKTDDALRAAQSCRAESWWCSALAGFASHEGGRFAAAESAYTVSLAAMPEAERCRWLDLSDVLEDDLLDRFRKLACNEREAFARRVFWLGAPLLSVAPNDRFTEHLARLTRAKIAERSATTDGEVWADDQRALVMRYGWPKWYTRSERDFGSQLQPSIAGHDASMAYDYVPRIHALDSLTRLRADDWRLAEPRAVSGYSAPSARTMHDLQSQIAVFRRGDSALAVAAWDARKDPTMVRGVLDFALVLAAAPDRQWVARDTSDNSVGRLTLTAPIDSGVVSLEVVTRLEKHAARSRIGLPPRPSGAVTLSDLLLYSSSDEAVYQLGAVRDSALSSNRVPASRSVGVFWEAYGIPPDNRPVSFTLSIEQVGSSWTQRVAEKLRLSDPTSAARIQWQEVPRITNGVAGRGVRVDLSRLRGGRYRVELVVAAPGVPAATSSREIEVP
jgi:hypothetical protein